MQQGMYMLGWYTAPTAVDTTTFVDYISFICVWMHLFIPYSIWLYWLGLSRSKDVSVLTIYHWPQGTAKGCLAGTLHHLRAPKGPLHHHPRMPGFLWAKAQGQHVSQHCVQKGNGRKPVHCIDGLPHSSILHHLETKSSRRKIPLMISWAPSPPWLP